MAKDGKKYTSKGERANVSRATLNSIRAETLGAVKMLNIQSAYLKGQNPWMTIANPSKEQTNKRFIRVRANDVYGHPKDRARGFAV